MTKEFYLKLKYSNHYLPESVPWSDRASRRRKFTYKDLESMTDKLIAITDIVEIDEKYEKRMNEKERDWYKGQEETPVVEELNLFEEYSEIDDSNLNEALDKLEGDPDAES